MPVLENPRHERYAQGIAKGKSQREAYRLAGFESEADDTVDAAASRLLSDVRVYERVQELIRRLASKVEVTLESLAWELDEARHLALTEKQSSAAVSATMGKAKLFGLLVDKVKHSGTVHVVTITAKQLDSLSPDELASLESALPVLQKLGLIGSDRPAAPEAGSTEEP